MIVLLLNFIGLCFSIFIIVIVILTWTNTNKLVHNETFKQILGEGIDHNCHDNTTKKECAKDNMGCQWNDSMNWCEPIFIPCSNRRTDVDCISRDPYGSAAPSCQWKDLNSSAKERTNSQGCLPICPDGPTIGLIECTNRCKTRACIQQCLYACTAAGGPPT